MCTRNRNIIKFRFSSHEDGKEATLTDSINFSVADKLGNRIQNQKMAISIEARRNHAPTIRSGNHVLVSPLMVF